MCDFINLEEIVKTWRKFAQNIWQPCVVYYFKLKAVFIDFIYNFNLMLLIFYLKKRAFIAKNCLKK